MADDGDNMDHHAESNASTPSSTGPKSTTKAPKDRKCPFCDTSFTSSSLGRHLDLYIKPKNPKPPDGLHDVDEIRKLRGNITRRQPRSSTKASTDGGRNSNAQQEDTNGRLNHHASSQSSTRHDSQMPEAEESPMESPVHPRGMHDAQPSVSAPNWQATGVINNLPPRAPSRNNNAPPTGQAQRVQDMRRDATGNRIPRPEHESESMWKLQQDAELGRVAEMALREVLGSLEAAQKRVEPRTLFDDIDFFSLSFPGLCLAILPPPGTLFSPSPFPSAESWTLGPPGLRQYEAMNRFLNERLINRRKVEHIPDSVAFKHHTHLSGAWEHWQNLPESDRTSAWTLETLRSFTRLQEQKNRLRTELEQSQQHARHMEAEYDRLSRCQLPREYLMHPPLTIPVEPAVLRDLKPAQFRSGIAETGYDAEALLSKWRARIRATQRPSRVAKQAPGQSSSIYTEQHSSEVRDSIILNGSVWNVGGPMPRHLEPHSEPIDARAEIDIVSYETPPNPGAVVTADEDEDGERARLLGGADVLAPGAAEDVDANGYANYAAQNSLMRRMYPHPHPSPSGGGGGVMGRDVDGAGVPVLVNANGKRPLAGMGMGMGMGPRPTTKMYRAQHDGSEM